MEVSSELRDLQYLIKEIVFSSMGCSEGNIDYDSICRKNIERNEAMMCMLGVVPLR